MKPEELKNMDVAFVKPPAITFAVAADLQDENEVLAGKVLAHNPIWGAENYERTERVGCLLIDPFDRGGWLKIALGSKQLADQVDMALTSARILHGMQPGHPKLGIVIRYLGKDEDRGYHKYRATALRMLKDRS